MPASATEAQERGYAAGLRGADPRMCPYEKMTVEWNDWQKFHGMACQIRLYAGARDSVKCTGR